MSLCGALTNLKGLKLYNVCNDNMGNRISDQGMLKQSWTSKLKGKELVGALIWMKKEVGWYSFDAAWSGCLIIILTIIFNYNFNYYLFSFG